MNFDFAMYYRVSQVDSYVGKIDIIAFNCIMYIYFCMGCVLTPKVPWHKFDKIAKTNFVLLQA